MLGFKGLTHALNERHSNSNIEFHMDIFKREFKIDMPSYKINTIMNDHNQKKMQAVQIGDKMREDQK